IYPYEPTNINVTATNNIYFNVYTSTSLYDYDHGYILELVGIQGLDLEPQSMTLDLTSVPPGDPVIATWNLLNKRLEPVPNPGTVQYSYYLSTDLTVDMSDIFLETRTGPAPLPFQSIQFADKVYLDVLPGVFGDF